MWTNKEKTQHSKKHIEFAGRAENPGDFAELYIHLKEEDM